jgi:hypothetical protein
VPFAAGMKQAGVVPDHHAANAAVSRWLRERTFIVSDKRSLRWPMRASTAPRVKCRLPGCWLNARSYNSFLRLTAAVAAPGGDAAGFAAGQREVVLSAGRPCLCTRGREWCHWARGAQGAPQLSVKPRPGRAFGPGHPGVARGAFARHGGIPGLVMGKRNGRRPGPICTPHPTGQVIAIEVTIARQWS